MSEVGDGGVGGENSNGECHSEVVQAFDKRGEGSDCDGTGWAHSIYCDIFVFCF